MKGFHEVPYVSFLLTWYSVKVSALNISQLLSEQNEEYLLVEVLLWTILSVQVWIDGWTV